MSVSSKLNRSLAGGIVKRQGNGNGRLWRAWEGRKRKEKRVIFRIGLSIKNI